MAEEQRDKDRAVELATQDRVEISVANRNLQIASGASPDPNVGTGFYPADSPSEVQHADRMAAARAAKAEKAAAKAAESAPVARPSAPRKPRKARKQ